MAEASARTREEALKLPQLPAPASPWRLSHEILLAELEDKPNARLTCGRPQRGGGDPGTRAMPKALLRIPFDDPDRRRIPARARIVELGTVRHDDEGRLLRTQLDEVTRR